MSDDATTGGAITHPKVTGAFAREQEARAESAPKGDSRLLLLTVRQACKIVAAGIERYLGMKGQDV